jgi:hypothetical protein
MKPTNIVISNVASEDNSKIADLLERVSRPVEGVEAIIQECQALCERN